jgi:hypothetical protein
MIMSATTPMGTPAPAPFPPAPEAKKSKKTKPLYKRVWFWIAILAVLGIIGTAANSGSTSSSSTTQGDGAAAAPPAAATIGTAVRDGDFEFTVTKLERGTTTLGGEYLNTTAQGEFVLVNLTVRNIGNEPGTLFDQNVKLFDTQGREYRADSAAAVYLEGNSDVIAQTINPGNQVSGTIVFDVAAGTQLASLDLHDSAFSGGVSVALS